MPHHRDTHSLPAGLACHASVARGLRLVGLVLILMPPAITSASPAGEPTRDDEAGASAREPRLGDERGARGDPEAESWRAPNRFWTAAEITTILALGGTQYWIDKGGAPAAAGLVDTP
jgi:hypothetical protein